MMMECQPLFKETLFQSHLKLIYASLTDVYAFRTTVYFLGCDTKRVKITRQPHYLNTALSRFAIHQLFYPHC